MFWTARDSSLRLGHSCCAVLLLCAITQDSPKPPAPANAARAGDGRGALAVLRRDGLMLPFASFNRDTWQISWPINPMMLEMPPTIAAIPDRWWGTRSPDQWRAWLTTGENQALEPTAPLPFRIFCAPRLGLRTNYRSALPLPPAPVEPYPKDGLVISGDVSLEPIESVARESAEWTTLSVTLLKEFDRVEEDTLRKVRANTGWRHIIPADERRKQPVRLESWYRSPSGEPGWTVSYVEAVRQYPPEPEDRGCGLETLVSGWLHHYNGALQKASDLRGKITYCDRVGATYMLPFGRIRPRERIYWVFQLSGWEDEWYEVAEVGREKTRYVIELHAGSRNSCPPDR
jgi:hypothetical protein